MLATPVNSVAARGHRVGRHRLSGQIVLPHQLDGGPVEPRGRVELVLRRRRPVVEHRLMQQLKHDRRRRPVAARWASSAASAAARAAARDRQPGGVDAQVRPVVGHPLQHGHRIVEPGRIRMFRRQPVVDRDDGAPAAPGELHALPVVDVEVAEHESPEWQ